MKAAFQPWALQWTVEWCVISIWLLRSDHTILMSGWVSSLGAHARPETAPSCLLHLCFCVAIVFLLRCNAVTIYHLNAQWEHITPPHKPRPLAHQIRAIDRTAARWEATQISAVWGWMRLNISFFPQQRLTRCAILYGCLRGGVVFLLQTTTFATPLQLFTINSFEEEALHVAQFQIQSEMSRVLLNAGRAAPFTKAEEKDSLFFILWSQVPQIWLHNSALHSCANISALHSETEDRMNSLSKVNINAHFWLYTICLSLLYVWSPITWGPLVICNNYWRHLWSHVNLPFGK